MYPSSHSILPIEVRNSFLNLNFFNLIIFFFISDIYSFLGEDKDEEKIRQFSGWNDHCGDLRGPYQDQSIRCFAYVAKEGLCLRANTVSTYCELNRQVKFLIKFSEFFNENF